MADLLRHPTSFPSTWVLREAKSFAARWETAKAIRWEMWELKTKVDFAESRFQFEQSLFKPREIHFPPPLWVAWEKSFFATLFDLDSFETWLWVDYSAMLDALIWYRDRIVDLSYGCAPFQADLDRCLANVAFLLAGELPVHIFMPLDDEPEDVYQMSGEPGYPPTYDQRVTLIQIELGTGEGKIRPSYEKKDKRCRDSSEAY